MNDVILVLSHFFTWKFFLLLGSTVTLGLNVPERYLKPFRSVKANIYLFFVIALASAIGTFIPQGKPPEEALAKFGSFWAAVFQKLGFLDIYHTWWFAALLALMAFNVIVCKLRRLPFLINGPVRKKSKADDENPSRLLSKSKQRADFVSHHSAKETASRLQAWLESRSLKPNESVLEQGVLLSGARHRFQRWGDFILHVSIIVILAGNLMGVLFGFEEVLPIPQSGTMRMKNRPYDVTLKNFDVKYYKGSGAPSLYQSELEVQSEGKQIATKKIVVNDPLDIDRVRFYQATWGMMPQIRSSTLRLAGQDVTLRPGQVVPIPHTPLSVRVNDFLPTFDILRDGTPTTTDIEGKNPALQVDFLEKGIVQARMWLLQNDPYTAFRLQEGKVLPTPPPPFYIVDIDPVLFSGIQVAYDPGAPLFWFGVITLVIGLCLHFYMHQRRLRILVLPKGKSSEVWVGGWNSRVAEDFRLEFEDWVDEMKRAVA